ncbi:MAG TPA: NAD(P)H-dependent oxidoreductase [Phenylobacterium sp.]|uniref:NAD(P)H-dependent oxidoreductase n=1 Tax=Phenylobacterium sp. TaxID=1871053 RepID=UPI002F94C673
MKHAVILAHPSADSLNGAIAKAYADAVRDLGHEVVWRDLYRMRWDPVLKAAEIPGRHGPARFHKDVVAERARLADVDVFAFIYPIWFNAPPAMLKGYVDRVFGMGFGFEPAFGGVEPRLRGKDLISFTTSGAPEFWLQETGALEDLMRNFDRYLGQAVGLRVTDHLHFGGIVEGIRPDVVEEMLSQVRQAAASFGQPSDQPETTRQGS